MLPKVHLTPVISVTSQYYDHRIPVGADGTTFHITGRKFAANSAITFLFSVVIKQDMPVVSDVSGNVSMDLIVTSDWPLGRHELIAHDASNNTTNTGVEFSIVPQGYNGTPGPNDSPTNTANFKVSMEIQMQSGGTIWSQASELNVKGQSDSQGGTVCSPSDNGLQNGNEYPGPNGIATRISTYICDNTSSYYKDGRIIYDETLETNTFSDVGGKCDLINPQPSYIHMTGTFTSSRQFIGIITQSPAGDDQYHCIGDLSFNGTTTGAAGIWVGTVSNL
jgi:hypothetical protein